MAKLKDGFYKQTASSMGSNLHVLLAGGGAKPISDFASAFNVKIWGQDFDGSKDVKGNLTLGYSQIYIGDGTDNFRIGWGASNMYCYHNYYGHYFSTKSGEVMNINSSGNVGIGTTDPKYKLHVNGDIRGSSIYSAHTYINTGGNGIYLSGSGIYYHNTNNSWVSDLITFDSGSVNLRQNTACLGTLSVQGTGTFNSQIISNVADGTAPLVVASTTKVNNLNADLLDGYHVTHFMSYIKGSGYVQANLLNSELWNVAGGDGYIEYYDNGRWFNSRWGRVSAHYGFDGDLRGNASSATKLQTARTIWGQSFDGTDNVRGDIYVVSKSSTGTNEDSGIIRFNGVFDPSQNFVQGPSIRAIGNIGYGMHRFAIFQHYGNDYSSESEVFSILPKGNVGIGTTNPSYKLDVNGSIRANGNVLLEAANSTTGGGIAFWDASGWINGTINAKNLILNYAGGNVGVGILSPKAKLHVNGDTLINKRLTIGQDLGNWDSSRAELELISPSGQATDFWMGSGQRDWSISTRTPSENSVLCLYAYTTSANAVVTIEKSGNTIIRGNLNIGASDTRNYIAFRGTTGDDQVLHQNTFIGENHFGGTESSELILFKGNDFGTHATSLSTSGPDRIRYIAAAHLFQIYKSALSGTFADICTSTVPVNMLAIHQDSIQTYAPLVIVGEKYSGNYGINMQNSDIVGINAMYTQDNAEDGGEGLQFSRGNGYYDSIWASGGVLYFSPNGNLNRSGSYSNNYTVLHTGNYTGTLDGRYVNTTGDTMTGNLVIGNTTIYASGTNGGTNSLAVADDCILGDCNVGGVLGLKATNATIAGIKFFNSSSASLGQLTAVDVNTLKWDSKVLLHSSNWPSYIGGDGYVMQTWTIDATGLDQNTWYPVTMDLSSLHWTRIEVKETLSSRSKPSWSTHDAGFHVIKIWHSIGYGWGTTSAVSQRLILQSDYAWCNTDPVRGIGQLSSSSTEYVYVRGGGRYYVSTSHNVVPTLRTSTYTVYDQSVGPTTSTPAGITAMYSDKSIHAPHFYESSDATLKTNIETINTSDNIPQLKSFNWKEDGKHSYGLIAQELEEMGYTELVEESNGKKTVQYSAALSLIVGKLQVKIKELEKEIEILKNKN